MFFVLKRFEFIMMMVFSMTNRLALNKVNHKIPLDKGDIIMTFHNFFNESLITIIKTINLRRVITRHGFQFM